MNFVKIPLIVIVFLTASLIVGGQQLSQSVLVDSFDSIPCDELLGRADAFYAELMNNPSDSGMVIIFSNAKNAKGYRSLLTASAYNRNFDDSRIRILLSSKPSTAAVQFWRVVNGSDAPAVEELIEPPREISKSFVFGYADENGVCPTFVPKLYANLIKEHPGSFGRIVVRGNSWSNRKAFADQFTETLREGEGLTSNQLRVSYVHRPHNVLTDAEFWFIPAGKK